MGTQMRLASCTNAFIANESDMPRWGQLGCNGFIVLDSHLQVVNPCTSAFLEVQDLAFRHVEEIMDRLVDGKDVSVKLKGPNLEKLDGDEAVDGDAPDAQRSTALQSGG
jgi:hypothetical protein